MLQIYHVSHLQFLASIACEYSMSIVRYRYHDVSPILDTGIILAVENNDGDRYGVWGWVVG